MKRHLFTAMAVAATMAAPALYAQTTTTTTQPMPVAGAQMMKHQGPSHNKMMAELNLSAAQKAQVKAIHAKYEPQIKAEREKMRPQMEATRAARAKGDTATVRADRVNARTAMGPMQQVRQQEMAEVRAILTPAQQQKFDTMKQHGEMGRKGMKMGKMNKTARMTGTAPVPAANPQ